jgi:hypothetical protein
VRIAYSSLFAVDILVYLMLLVFTVYVTRIFVCKNPENYRSIHLLIVYTATYLIIAIRLIEFGYFLKSYATGCWFYRGQLIFMLCEVLSIFFIVLIGIVQFSKSSNTLIEL